MAAHVTHEVRNPLSSIGLNVEMLEDELVDGSAEAKGLFKAIQREIDRLTAVTEEYLRLARLPQPRLEADDLGTLERFYKRLGLDVLTREDDRIWMAAGEHSRLGIWSPGVKEHGDRGGRHVHFALSTTGGTLEKLTEDLRLDGIRVKDDSHLSRQPRRRLADAPRVPGENRVSVDDRHVRLYRSAHR